MKVLFIGDLSSYARARQRYLAIKDLGYTVKGVSWLPLETNLTSKKPPIWGRIRHKLGYPVDRVNLNESFPSIVKEFVPEVIWVEKANTIYPKVYAAIKSEYPAIKIIYYSEDDIFIANNRPVYLRKSLPLFDIVCTTKPRNIHELPKLGVRKVKCVYQAYDKKIHRPLDLSESEQKEWGAEVSFIGTFENDRANQMLFLAEHGIPVRVWGANWESWKSRHSNLKIECRGAYNDDFLKVISSTKINLNFLRKSNRDQHTNRSLEIPACQGFMLAERTDEHLHLFEEGKEAAFFSTSEELVKQVKYYLTHASERENIAQAGWKRCISSGYSHHARLKEIFSEILPLKK